MRQNHILTYSSVVEQRMSIPPSAPSQPPSPTPTASTVHIFHLKSRVEYVILWVSQKLEVCILAKFCNYGLLSQVDYHSKSRLDILCQEPVSRSKYL